MKMYLFLLLLFMFQYSIDGFILPKPPFFCQMLNFNFQSDKATKDLIEYFQNKLPTRVSTEEYKQINHDYLIINSPSTTFLHPMVSANISAIAETIYNDKTEPDSRAKPFYAILTGMGRGKTRTLTSLDMVYCQNFSDVLSIAITYNHLWDSIDDYIVADNTKNFILSVISRIISIHYRVEFYQAEKFIKDEAFLSIVRSLDSSVILHEFLRFIIRQERVSGRIIKNLIVMIDETAKAKDNYGVKAIGSIRGMLLNKQLIKEDPININLIMSTLDVSALGLSSSGRPVIVIDIPDDLNPQEIIEKWIPVYRNIYFSNAYDKLRLSMLISIFSPIPRAIEELVNAIPKTSTNEAIELNSIALATLYNDTLKRLKIRYSNKKQIIKAKQFYPVLFNTELKVTEDINNLIVNDIFVNSFKAFEYNKFQYLIPRTSIASFLFMDKSNSPFLTPLFRIFELIISSITNEKPVTLGLLLVNIVTSLINSKLEILNSLAMDAKEDIVKEELCSFFGLSDDTLIGFNNPHLTNKLLTPIIISSKGSEFKKLKSSYSNSGLFIDQCNQIVLDEDLSYIELQLHNKECVDGAWLLRTKANQSFCLFIECKSPRIKPLKSNKKSIHKSPHQALHLINIASKIATSLDGNIKENSLADALASGRFLYVYIRPSEESTSHAFDGYNNIVELGGIEAKHFLNFFNNLYQFSRVASDASVQEYAKATSKEN